MKISNVKISKINKRFITALIAGAISISLVGCNNGKKTIEYDSTRDYEAEYMDNTDEALQSIIEDYEEVVEIANTYWEAKNNDDEEALQKFYTEMRKIYIDYDETKARKANALLPYLMQAEALYRNTDYTFNDEEMDIVNSLDLNMTAGYTTPEFEKVFGSTNDSNKRK